MTSGAAVTHALVIANPIAGRGLGERIGRAVVHELRGQGVAAEMHLTRGRGDGRARVAAVAGRGIDAVIAVGGDGTLREVLEGLAGADIVAGVVPIGTANVLARDLGLPQDVHSAVNIILGGRWVPLEVARVGGRLCIFGASVGFDAMAVREVERRRRGAITRWTWATALARTFAVYRPPRLRVELDGTTLPYHWGFVLISNCVRYGGLLRLPKPRLGDGLFQAYLVRDASRVRLVAAAACGLLGRLPDRVCTLARVRRARITAEQPVPYQVDGDLDGETPMAIEVSERQYRLLVPCLDSRLT